jgi:hypothetical protein
MHNKASVSPFRLLLWLLVTFAWVQGCNRFDGDTNPALLSGDHDSSPGSKPCGKISLQWQGVSYHIGRKLGQGVNGAVFELQRQDGIDSEWVVKIFEGASVAEVRWKANRDLKLAKEFSNLIPEAHFRYAYQAPIHTDTPAQSAVALLIKRKVKGFTMYEMRHRFRQWPFMVPVAKEAFYNFKSNLKQTMLEKLELGEFFLWDLHHNNILFSANLNKWTLVDAEMTKGFDTFLKELESIDQVETYHPIYKIKSLLNEYHIMSKQEFVDRMLDIYFGDFENLMQDILLKQNYVD